MRSLLVLTAAAILGASVLGAGLLVRAPLEHGAQELAAMRGSLDGLREAIEETAAGPARQAARPRGPDPNRRYAVATEGAPARGPATARVTVIEFADFQ